MKSALQTEGFDCAPLVLGCHASKTDGREFWGGNVQGDQDRQGGEGHHGGADAVRRGRTDGGRRHRRRRMVDVNYKDGLAVTGKAPVVRRFPMIAGIDFAGTVQQSSHPALEGRRQGDLQRLGHGRDPSRRLCREGARQGRLAGAAAGWHDGARCDGDRHRRLHRDAERAGAGEARADAEGRPGRRHRRRRRRRLGGDRAVVEARLSGHRLDRAGRRKRLICATSAPPR